ncbi:hypothetical protein JYU34_015524 [Plutella xylostella]|uniref:Mutant cadherin n=1 Tax=Plutella xylostella TaxID=51655 RepID=A0ABQ7Q7B3_PLUXY|nr:hypothetical protein JYU34_015524 [Plutella xylostella]
MATQVLKCNSCNIVINEMLAFVQNKILVMDNVSLIRICATAFSADAISEAKNLLFESIPSTVKKVIRKRTGKENRDIEDMITLLRGTEPDIIPVFVARDLYKLPPVTFDHLDATSLLKDITLLKAQVQQLRQNSVSSDQLQELRSELQNLKLASIVNVDFEYSNINSKRGGGYCDSGPFGLPHMSSNDIGQEYKTVSCDKEVTNTERMSSYSHPAEKISPVSVVPLIHNNQIKKTCAAPVRESLRGVNNIGASGKSTRGNEAMLSTPIKEVLDCPIPSNDDMKLNQVPDEQRKTLAEIVSVDKKDNKDNEGWTIVQARKRKSRFANQTGCAIILDPKCKFRAAKTKIPMYLSNVDKESSAKDISDYILEQTGENVTLEKVRMKKLQDYDSYKFFVSRHRLPLFLDKDLWPEDIIFRRFYNLNRNRDPNAITECVSKPPIPKQDD